MPSSTRRSVYRAGRFSVPVTFPVLTGRAGHPRLRDDVGIVPYILAELRTIQRTLH